MVLQLTLTSIAVIAAFITQDQLMIIGAIACVIMDVLWLRK
jgi:hypothetical protein